MLSVFKTDLDIEKHKSVTSGGSLKDLGKDLEEMKLELAAEKKKTGNGTSTILSDMLKDPTSAGYTMLKQSVMTSVKSNL